MLVDAGDVFGDNGSSLEDMIRAEYLVRGMNLVGYDASAVGEADFRFGEAFFSSRRVEAKFTFTAANLRRASDGAAYMAGFFKRTIDDLDVVIVGVIGGDHASSLAKATRVDGLELIVESATSAVKAAFSEAEKDAKPFGNPARRSHLRVVLAHMSIEAARKLAKALEGVDIVIAAHGLHEPTQPETIGDTLLVGAGYEGKWIGRLDLELLPSRGGIEARVVTSVELNAAHADDPEAAALYQDYLAELMRRAADLGKGIPQEQPKNGGYVGVQACKGCHPSQVSQWEGTQHARAWNTLLRSNNDYSPSCYGCHTTGFGFKTGFRLPTDESTKQLVNVQCEVCHGPGAEHAKAPVAGWSVDPKTVCKRCHEAQRSPNFDLATYLQKVTH